jgi:hypothetical protein
MRSIHFVNISHFSADLLCATQLSAFMSLSRGIRLMYTQAFLSFSCTFFCFASCGQEVCLQFVRGNNNCNVV